MSNQKISQMTTVAYSSLDGSEFIPIVKSSSNEKVTVNGTIIYTVHSAIDKVSTNPLNAAVASNSAGLGVNIVAGRGDGTGTGGKVNVQGGNAGATSGDGGAAYLQGGYGSPSGGNGGEAAIGGGSGYGTGHAGGATYLTGGWGYVGAHGGDVTITSGKVVSGAGLAGNISFAPAQNTSGVYGHVLMSGIPTADPHVAGVLFTNTSSLQLFLSRG